MSTFFKYINTINKQESVKDYINSNKISEKVIRILEDLFETEKTKDYFKIDHNKRKVHFNLGISTKERQQLSEMISLIYPNKNINSLTSDLFPLKEEEIPKIKNELNTQGFHVFDDLLDNLICDELISGLEKISFHTKKSTKKIKEITQKSISKINGNTAWATNQQDILKIPAVQKLAFDNNLLNLVGEFLGAEPILCQTNCWWSVNKSMHRSNLSSNAQLFHQDTEYLKFVKVFIYLTDVDEKNGAHQYVQGSSKFAQEKLGKDYKPSNRVEDNVVNELFGKENVITFSGKKGCIIIEDTFGLHKGTPVLEGARLLLQLEYCNSLYFHAGYSFGLEELDNDIKELAKTYPRIFSNFTNNVGELNEKKFRFFNHKTLSQKVKDKIKSYL